MEKVKERAIRKIKIQAAMMGANIIYLTQNTTTGNQAGSKYQSGKSTETNMTGVAYSNQNPNYNDFVKLIGEKTEFQTSKKYKLSGSATDYDDMEFVKSVKIEKIYTEGGLIMMKAHIADVDYNTFRVIYFSKNRFILVVKDEDVIYNFKVQLNAD